MNHLPNGLAKSAGRAPGLPFSRLHGPAYIPAADEILNTGFHNPSPAKRRRALLTPYRPVAVRDREHHIFGCCVAIGAELLCAADWTRVGSLWSAHRNARPRKLFCGRAFEQTIRVRRSDLRTCRTNQGGFAASPQRCRSSSSVPHRPWSPSR